MVLLEQFYHGQLVHHGKASGEPRILARSKGVSEDLAQYALTLGAAAPFPEAPEVSAIIVRGGRDIPFLLIRARQHASGIITQHYVFMPSDVPRLLQGNLQAFLPLLEAEIPVFEQLGDTLAGVELTIPEPLSYSAQADMLLELMTYTRNNTRLIEPILSTVIEGKVLHVCHAPASLRTRLNFVQGLLTLLPASTRFSVTFALHSAGTKLPNAQIIFVDDNTALPASASIYDWSTGVTSPNIENDYSRFILSQLRLDAELAVQQANALTPTAGWRFRSGDSLASALAYASHRSRIDKAIENNLPVATTDVAKILAEDPTLDDSARLAYAEHLIHFALALEDMTGTEAVAVTCGKFPIFANKVHTLLAEAVANGKAWLIFPALVRWLENPLSPQTPEWIDLLHKAALLELRDIVSAADIEGVKSYLYDLQRLDASLMISRIMPKVLEVTVPLAGEDAQIPSQILLLGMIHLDKDMFQRLLAMPQLTQHLPRELKAFLACLTGKQPLPKGSVLLEAAQVFDEEHRDEAIMRFVEMAYNSQQFVLIETPVLEHVARIAPTPRGMRHIAMTLNLARHVNDEMLDKLPIPAPRLVLQLFLACRRYDLLAKAMTDQAKNVYGGERQMEYIQSIQETFARTPLPVADLVKAITIMRDSYIKDVPLTCAICGALVASNYAEELDALAQEATQAMLTDRRYWQVIHIEAPLALIRYHMRYQSHRAVRQLVRLLPSVAASHEDKVGLNSISQSYKTLVADEAYKALALEVLRQYVRLAPQKPSERIVNFYSQELSKEQADKLKRAYVFSDFTNQLDLSAYAVAVKLTADLLQRAYEAFLKDRPTAEQLEAIRESIRVRVDKRRQRTFAQELLRLIQAVLGLSRAADSKTLAYEQINAIVKGQQNPRHVLELFRAGGGFFAKGAVYQLRPRAGSQPFGDLSPLDVLEHVTIANDVLHRPLQLFPAGKRLWTYAELADELESAVTMLSEADAQLAVKGLASDWQRLAELVPLLAKDADTTLGDEKSKTGKKLDSQLQLPKHPLEFYRFIYGYFIVQ